MKTVADIVTEAGGPAKVAEALEGKITPDAVRKWTRNGVPDRYWETLTSLTSADIPALFAANELLRSETAIPGKGVVNG